MTDNKLPTIWEQAQSKGVTRREFLRAAACMTAMLRLERMHPGRQPQPHGSHPGP